MANDKEIQEYYRLSLQYLEGAKTNLNSNLVEPAMFNAIHALELALKSALLKKTGDDFKTHNVGGIFGKHFRDQIGKQKCKSINKILMRYNFPRYPDQPTIPKDEAKNDIGFISDLIEYDVYDFLR